MSIKRRDFLKQAGLLAGAASVIPASAWSSSNVMPNDRITLGFIGVGKQGEGLLRGFLNSPETHVLAVCDVDANKMERARKNVDAYYSKQKELNYKGCDAYRDFRDVLERKDIDAVVIATPDHWHAIPAIMAARAGKDIYCEKPLTLTIAEGREMVNEVRRHNRVFQTGSMQRSSSGFRQACELVRNGYIGDVKTVRVSIRTGFIPHPIVCELPEEPKPAELDWDMWQGPAPNRPYNAILAPPISFTGYPAWRNYRDYSGGGMTDWGAHHFDIAQWGLGMDYSGPVEINPPDDKDYKLLTYKYANGVVMDTDFDDNRILFTGTDGWIDVNRSYLKASNPKLVNHKIGPNEIRLYHSNDHHDDWLQAIRNRRIPITDVEIGCRSVTVCHLGNLAVQLGRKLQWDPDTENFVNDPEANRLKERSKRSPWYL